MDPRGQFNFAAFHQTAALRNTYHTLRDLDFLTIDEHGVLVGGTVAKGVTITANLKEAE